MCYAYHYTTEEGFEGIIESQELWATNIYHLNDWTEFEYGKNALVKKVEALADDKDAADAAKQLLTYLYNARPQLFVCSFSASEKGGDDLSQWRAYCPRGGYAVGFPIAELHEHTQSVGLGQWNLMECAYGALDADQFAKGLTTIMNNIFELAGGARAFRTQFPFKDPDKNGFLTMLWRYVAKYKHEAFDAECEWRLVRLLTHGSRPKFRLANGALVPYVSFSMKSADLWRQAEIVMSPCLPDVAMCREAVLREFLASELATHSLPVDCTKRIRSSIAPYRASTGG